MKISEHTLQCQVIQYLRTKGHYCFSCPNGFWNGIKNKVKKMCYIKKLKREGLLNGVADVIILQPNAHTIFLELKVGRNKQSNYQKLFEDNVKELGFEYYVIRNLDEVIKLGL
jgi:hypothetical protein